MEQIFPRWFIAYVAPGLHDEVPGADFYQPVYVSKRYNRKLRRLTKFRLPLLPGYAFISTTDPRSYRECFPSVVRGFVRSDSGDYLVASDQDIKDIHTLCHKICEFGYHYVLGTIKEGDEVYLKEDGYLSGTPARVTATHENGTVDIVFGANAFEVRKTVPSEKLTAA